jgi:hypothetical protein
MTFSKHFCFLLILVFISILTTYAQTPWSEWSKSESVTIERLITLLERSAKGKMLLDNARQKARELGMPFEEVIKMGEQSLTDSTLTRKFSPHNPFEVTYHHSSVITINRHLSWRDALLDLAHELTHFSERKPFNPYLAKFTPSGFIRSTIEERGGEAHAFVAECEVMAELFTKDYGQDTKCQKILTQSDPWAMAIKLFYQVGPYYKSLLKAPELEGHSFLKNLSEDQVLFVSSAMGVPYPLAALQEFRHVMGKVCENDRTRLKMLTLTSTKTSTTRSSAARGLTRRSPASLSPLGELNPLDEFRKNVEQRCSLANYSP